MEVTTDNYESILPELIEKIQACDFCSIDCELSGITNYKNLNSFDTPKIRYEKIKRNDERFLILQFGLCLFRRNEEETKSFTYDCDAYNCFLFPRSQNSKFTKDLPFSCLNSSVEFLCEQNFDFNKVFNKGITFMSKDTEENSRYKLMQTIEERKKPRNTLYPNNTNGKDNKEQVKEQIDKLMNEIEVFVNDPTQNKKEIRFTEFLLRIYVEKNLKQKYYQRLRYENKFLENKERLMTIYKIEAKDANSDLEIFEKEVGFSKLVWKLAQSGKLMLGHNMLTDVMQILRQFFSSPLPDKYEDFKSMTNSLFPRLLDTKHMASITPLKNMINNTALGEMDKILCKDPFPNIKINCKEYNIENQKLHEAGYDAFLTGISYLRMLHYLESFNSNKTSLLDFYINKIFLMKTYDMSFIDLKNQQDEPKRDNVFYIEFPPSWDTQDIYDLFAPFGGIFIAWIDDKSSFVALQNSDNVKKTAAQLVGVSGRDYRVYFYQTYVNQLNKNKGKSLKMSELNNQNNNNNNGIKSSGNNGNNNNNQNGSGDKRKRNTPPKSINLKNNNSGSRINSPRHSLNDQDAIEVQNEVKKIKSENSGLTPGINKLTTGTKPFDECKDW